MFSVGPRQAMPIRQRSTLVVCALMLIGGVCSSGDVGPACADNGRNRSFVIVRDPRVPLRRRRFESWQAQNQSNVVMQQQDFSCGAAALATICRYYFEDDVTEADVLAGIVENLSADELAEREENGLSLNDLFLVAKDLGYLAAAVELPPEKIIELQAPVIVRIEKHGYKHFVVLRGCLGDRIYLADPLRGNVRVAADVFLRQWSGEALILGKAGFGLPDDYPLALKKRRPVRTELEAFRRTLYLRR